MESVFILYNDISPLLEIIKNTSIQFIFRPFAKILTVDALIVVQEKLESNSSFCQNFWGNFIIIQRSLQNGTFMLTVIVTIPLLYHSLFFTCMLCSIIGVFWTEPIIIYNRVDCFDSLQRYFELVNSHELICVTASVHSTDTEYMNMMTLWFVQEIDLTTTS